MRLAVLGFFHEANTFASTRVDAEQWRKATLWGDEIESRYGSSDSTVGGFLAYAKTQTDVELVPLGFGWMTPSGPSERGAWEALCDAFLSELRRQGPWDGVLLPQHGAAVADGHEDADAEFVERVRAVVGPRAAIGVAVDMHANLTERLVDNVDVITAYQTNPHVDAAVQAFQCAELVASVIRGQIKPTIALARLPLAINILRQGTDDEPLATLLREAQASGRAKGAILVQLVAGFPYADVPAMGASVVAMTDDDPVLARHLADRLAAAVWTKRDELAGKSVAPASAFDGLKAESDVPILVLDTGDNVWAGSAGDGTQLLHEARRQGATRIGFSIVDPAIAAVAAKLKPGALISGALGARIDPRWSEPFPFRGIVLATHSGSFPVDGPTHLGNRHFDLGPTVGIRTDDGFDIAVHSLPSSTVSLEQFRIAGIEPTRLLAIVAKGVHSPRAAFEPIVRELRWVGSAGCTTADLSRLEYRQAGERFPLQSVELTSF